MRLCTLVTSACVDRIFLSLRRQRVRKRDTGRKGKREKERRLRKIFWEKGRERERDTVGEREREREKERRVRTKNCGRERGMEVTAVMVKTTAHL